MYFYSHRRFSPVFLLFALYATQFHLRESLGDDVGLKVPEGFEVTLYADDELAHDIFSMTTDTKGRIVVSGIGYIRILEDTNDDGKADKSTLFSDLPKSGAQGMYFDGQRLFCTGDEGLIMFSDQNRDDQADGPPQRILRLKTGGEHNAHAIRKGPDGWWYLIAGNTADVNGDYATLPTSPVKAPDAGVIFRIHPEFKGTEIVADGFRNAYDYDFSANGELFSYDSDGERDITLPWYRPTRVFQTLPASNHGWVSRSWKEPNSGLGMPPTLAEFGRGSPTGVVCYRHTQFPKKYYGAIIALDWTYGRVHAIPLKRNGCRWDGEPIDFITGVGQFGFAPTDAVIGPDGSLFVSVGGRGTRGGVYRVKYVGDEKPEFPPEITSPLLAANKKELASCLSIPQPLSSWSRGVWTPKALRIGAHPFLVAAADETLSPAQRIRAIEILVDLFEGVDDDLLQKLQASNSAEVRSRAAWAAGRTSAKLPTFALKTFLKDEDPLVVRTALEALYGADSEYLNNFALELAVASNNEDRQIRMGVIRLLSRLSHEAFVTFARSSVKNGWYSGLCVAAGYTTRKAGVSTYATNDIGLAILKSDRPADMKLDAALLIQMGLGGKGSNKDLPPVYDGYASPFDLTKYERELDPLLIGLAEIFPTGDSKVDHELARIIAMLTPSSPVILDKVLGQITPKSHPVDDIHHLIVASRIQVDRTEEQGTKIALALLDVEKKINDRKLPQDSNWADRIEEMYVAHVKRDPELPLRLVSNERFGLPNHILFVNELGEEHFEKAIAAYVRKVSEDPDNYPWTTDVIFVLGESQDPKVMDLIRSQLENFSIKPAALVALSVFADLQDRQVFFEGLESSELQVIDACIDAISRQTQNFTAEEMVSLFNAARRLKSDNNEFGVRSKIMQLLKRLSKQDFGFDPTEKGFAPQTEAMAKWSNWISNSYPTAVAAAAGDSGKELANWEKRIETIDWSAGDPLHGKKLFETRSCSRCHGTRKALGPDLSGVAGRFSRNDLMTAIVAPNRDVSPRYQTTTIGTSNGKVYTGLIVYESVDGLLLRNSLNQTFRIEAEDIEFRKMLPSSLMPAGLLKDLKDEDVADLLAYIQSLGATKTATAPTMK